jgi:hypothetical protein
MRNSGIAAGAITGFTAALLLNVLVFHRPVKRKQAPKTKAKLLVMPKSTA